MGQATVQVEVSEDLVEWLGGPEAAKARLPQSAVLEAVRSGEIDPSKGAQLLEMYLGDFAHLMAQHGIDYFDYDEEEWARELAGAERLVKTLSGEGTCREP